MNRNVRLWLVVGIAVIVAGLATYAVKVAVDAAQPKADPTTDVVVATEQLKTGGCLGESQVKLLKWPDKFRPAGAIATIADVKGRNLITPAVQNEPITENKLAPRDAGCGLQSTIDPGMRAMSVRVNEVIGVAGFVTPRTRVDVLVTLRENNNDSIARVVVRNVQVLTAGTRYDEAETNAQAKPIPSTVVTLMVTPADAERISLAASEGQIMLALRNPLDTDVSVTPGVRKTALMGSPVAAAAAPPPPRSTALARPQPRPATPPPTRKVVKCSSGKCVEFVL